MTIRILIIAVAALAAAMLVQRMGPAPEVQASIPVFEALSGGDTSGYARAVHPREFIFPEDHGPHPDFKTEWWYYTGNLEDTAGERFGFQFTLFRVGLAPTAADTTSDWSANQMYMGHFAVSDIENEQFYYFERFSRAAQDLAGATADPFRVWLDDWQAVSLEQMDTSVMPRQQIIAKEGGVSLTLTLENSKAIVLQGEKGLSQKAQGAGNASYYYSLTRLKASGAIEINGKTHKVSGNAWMDREWSTSVLGDDQIGWDWFSLQFDNGRELMYYQLRRQDGSAHPLSKGTLVAEDGSSTTLAVSDVQLTVLDHWTSPLSGRYPAKWRLEIPSRSISLTITPVFANQELDVSVRYWEGSVDIRGTEGAQTISGRGYVEMTGYAD